MRCNRCISFWCCVKMVSHIESCLSLWLKKTLFSEKSLQKQLEPRGFGELNPSREQHIITAAAGSVSLTVQDVLKVQKEINVTVLSLKSMKPKPKAASPHEQACFMVLKLKHPDIFLKAPDHCECCFSLKPPNRNALAHLHNEHSEYVGHSPSTLV